ncbi:hypothetical protein SLA2020_174130 [Shorea laevis]
MGDAVQGGKAEAVSKKKSKKAVESKEEDGKEEATSVTMENVVGWEEWWPWLSAWRLSKCPGGACGRRYGIWILWTGRMMIYLVMLCGMMISGT